MASPGLSTGDLAASALQANVLGSLYGLKPCAASVLSDMLGSLAQQQQLGGDLRGALLRAGRRLESECGSIDSLGSDSSFVGLAASTADQRRLALNLTAEEALWGAPLFPPLPSLPTVINESLSPLIWCLIVLISVVVIVSAVSRIDALFAGNQGGSRLSKKELRWQFLTLPMSGPHAFLYMSAMNVVIVLSLVAMTLASNRETRYMYRGGFEVLEWLFLYAFSVEWLAMYLNCADKCLYMTSAMTWIDLLAVVPSYVDLLFEKEDLSSIKVLRTARLLRVFRLAKLARRSERMQAISRGMVEAIPAFILTFVMVGVTLYFPSVIMHEIERGDWDPQVGCYRRMHRGQFEPGCSPFQDILQCMYWGITTVTTVGYGDVTPHTGLGKLVAGVSMIAGIIALALPIGLVSSSFHSTLKSSPRAYGESEHHEQDDDLSSISSQDEYRQLEMKGVEVAEG